MCRPNTRDGILDNSGYEQVLLCQISHDESLSSYNTSLQSSMPASPKTPFLFCVSYDTTFCFPTA